MTTAPTQSSGAMLNAGPTIVPRGATVSGAGRLLPLESIGRRMLLGALARLSLGRLTLVDGADRREYGVGGGPECVIRIHDHRFYTAAAFGGSLGASEAFMEGFWETDDLPGLVEILTVNYGVLASIEGPLSFLTQGINTLGYQLQRNTLAGSRRNIRAHYDLSNEFFAIFLDPSMTYSCAIFENGATTLMEAQHEKIDRACRKLALMPSDHLLEIGTGWGAMAIHAASRYGCRVTTTTISDRQHELAGQRIREAGLSDRITLLKQDYRALIGTYDKIVSIEMVEAVGAANFDGYFRACSRLLKPDGAMLLQSIVIRDQFFRRASRERDFLKKYIFPGSCLPSVQSLSASLTRATDLRSWHMEDIGPHYATTLAIWRNTFHSRLSEVRALGMDDRFIRMWDFYLAYCEGAFRARHVGDIQLLLTKPMYRGPAAGPAAGPL